jgi:circadian clock protein KaiC
MQHGEDSLSSNEEMEYTHTGVPGLDELLDNKGIPSGYSVSVIGSPGAGKTTLSMQFLYNGLLNFSEAGIYVSLDENLKFMFLSTRI